jgi:hypothetical protein
MGQTTHQKQFTTQTYGPDNPPKTVHYSNLKPENTVDTFGQGEGNGSREGKEQEEKEKEEQQTQRKRIRKQK